MKVSNRKNLFRFTEILEDMMQNQKFSLPMALVIMSKSSASRKKELIIKRTSLEIIDSLKTGVSFSQALQSCRSIDFDKSFIAFISFSEKTGNLGNTLSFLKERCLRQEENISRLKGAIVYPAFVVVIAILSLVFLVVYNSLLSKTQPNEIPQNGDIFSSLSNSFMFLLLFSAATGFYMKKNLTGSKLYEAFTGASFLVKNGESFCNAIEMAAAILEKNSLEGKIFSDARLRMEYGLDVKNAFLDSGLKNIPDVEAAFYFSDTSGEKNKVFERIAESLKRKYEKRRKICLKLIEPIFISGTGIFLLIFLTNTFMPFFMDYNLFGIN